MLRNVRAGHLFRIRLVSDSTSRRTASLWVGLSPRPGAGTSPQTWSLESSAGAPVELEVMQTCPEPTAFLSVEVVATTPQGLAGTLVVEVFPAGSDATGEPDWAREIPLPMGRSVRRCFMTIVS